MRASSCLLTRPGRGAEAWVEKRVHAKGRAPPAIVNDPQLAIHATHLVVASSRSARLARFTARSILTFSSCSPAAHPYLLNAYPSRPAMMHCRYLLYAGKASGLVAFDMILTAQLNVTYLKVGGACFHFYLTFRYADIRYQYVSVWRACALEWLAVRMQYGPAMVTIRTATC